MSETSQVNHDLLEEIFRHNNLSDLQFDDKTSAASVTHGSMQEVGGDLLYDANPTAFKESQSLLSNFDLFNWSVKESNEYSDFVPTDYVVYNDSSNSQNLESFVPHFSDCSVNGPTPLFNAIPAAAATPNTSSSGINSATVGDVSFADEKPIIISLSCNTSLDTVHVGDISTSPLFEPTAREAAGRQSLGKIRKSPRRRMKGTPKPKLYEVDEPFSDADEEKKRLNAKKARRNREVQKKKVDELNALIEELHRQLEQKDAQLLQKDTLIRQMKQEQERDIQQRMNQLRKELKDLEARK